MEVQVAYTVPVEVVVDLDTGEVSRVVVIDEEVALDSSPRGGVNTREYLPVEDKKIVAQAIGIAENAMWPAWENGW